MSFKKGDRVKNINNKIYEVTQDNLSSELTRVKNVITDNHEVIITANLKLATSPKINKIDTKVGLNIEIGKKYRVVGESGVFMAIVSFDNSKTVGLRPLYGTKETLFKRATQLRALEKLTGKIGIYDEVIVEDNKLNTTFIVVDTNEPNGILELEVWGESAPSIFVHESNIKKLWGEGA